MGVALNVHKLGDLNRAGLTDSADVIAGEEFRLGPARTFYRRDDRSITMRVTNDGKRFLSLLPVGDPVPNSVTVVLDWAEGLGTN